MLTAQAAPSNRTKMLRLIRLGFLLCFSSFAFPAWADTFTVTGNSVLGTASVDAGLGVLEFDIRTPVSNTALLTSDMGGLVLLTDSFANPAFGNLTLYGEDSPAAASLFRLDFNSATLVSSGGNIYIDSTGTLISGVPTPVVEK
jgi:hypothetical protein